MLKNTFLTGTLSRLVDCGYDLFRCGITSQKILGQQDDVSKKRILWVEYGLGLLEYVGAFLSSGPLLNMQLRHTFIDREFQRHFKSRQNQPNQMFHSKLPLLDRVQCARVATRLLEVNTKLLLVVENEAQVWEFTRNRLRTLLSRMYGFTSYEQLIQKQLDPNYFKSLYCEWMIVAFFPQMAVPLMQLAQTKFKSGAARIFSLSLLAELALRNNNQLQVDNDSVYFHGYSAPSLRFSERCTIDAIDLLMSHSSDDETNLFDLGQQKLSVLSDINSLAQSIPAIATFAADVQRLYSMLSALRQYPSELPLARVYEEERTEAALALISYLRSTHRDDLLTHYVTYLMDLHIQLGNAAEAAMSELLFIGLIPDQDRLQSNNNFYSNDETLPAISVPSQFVHQTARRVDQTQLESNGRSSNIHVKKSNDKSNTTMDVNEHRSPSIMTNRAINMKVERDENYTKSDKFPGRANIQANQAEKQYQSDIIPNDRAASTYSIFGSKRTLTARNSILLTNNVSNFSIMSTGTSDGGTQLVLFPSQTTNERLQMIITHARDGLLEAMSWEESLVLSRLAAARLYRSPSSNDLSELQCLLQSQKDIVEHIQREADATGRRRQRNSYYLVYYLPVHYKSHIESKGLQSTNNSGQSHTLSHLESRMFIYRDDANMSVAKFESELRSKLKRLLHKQNKSCPIHGTETHSTQHVSSSKLPSTTTLDIKKIPLDISSFVQRSETSFVQPSNTSFTESSDASADLTSLPTKQLVIDTNVNKFHEHTTTMNGKPLECQCIYSCQISVVTVQPARLEIQEQLEHDTTAQYSSELNDSYKQSNTILPDGTQSTFQQVYGKKSTMNSYPALKSGAFNIPSWDTSDLQRELAIDDHVASSLLRWTNIHSNSLHGTVTNYLNNSPNPRWSTSSVHTSCIHYIDIEPTRNKSPLHLISTDRDMFHPNKIKHYRTRSVASVGASVFSELHTHRSISTPNVHSLRQDLMHQRHDLSQGQDVSPRRDTHLADLTPRRDTYQTRTPLASSRYEVPNLPSSEPYIAQQAPILAAPCSLIFSVRYASIPIDSSLLTFNGGHEQLNDSATTSMSSQVSDSNRLYIDTTNQYDQYHFDNKQILETAREDIWNLTLSDKLLHHSYHTMPRRIRQGREYARVAVFVCDQPWKRGKSGSDTLDTWIWRHYFITSNAFPSVSRRSSVMRIYRILFNPLDYAIETLIEKNNELKDAALRTSSSQVTRPHFLTGQLKGILDAEVSGGIGNYETFLTGEYRQRHPEIYSHVRDAMITQPQEENKIPLSPDFTESDSNLNVSESNTESTTNLGKSRLENGRLLALQYVLAEQCHLCLYGLKIHKTKCSQEMHPFHDYLCQRLLKVCKRLPQYNVPLLDGLHHEVQSCMFDPQKAYM